MREGAERERGTRVVYFGTPAFAVPALRALAGRDGFDVVLTVSRPDRPAGRGQRVQRSEVAAAASQLGIPLFQPESLRTAATRDRLAAAGADLFVVAAYGQIFGPKVLALPRVACLNVHASLLPKYRGASPIAAAIVAGDTRTGVSLMVMDEGLDTGDVIETVSVPIPPDATTASLTEDLGDAAAGLVTDTTRRFLTGELVPVPQRGAASLTRPLVKADGWLDWSRPAPDLSRQVRAMWPWPRAWTTVAGAGTPVVMQVHATTAVLTGAPGGPGAPGTVVSIDDAPVVVTARGLLRLDVVQFPGDGPKPGRAMLRAGRIGPGSLIGAEEDGPADRLALVVPVTG